VLIAVAVVLGLFLLRAMDDSPTFSLAGNDSAEESSGDDEPADAGAGADDGEPGDAPDEGGGDDGGDEPAEPQVRPPGEITVIVLNGSGVQGAAGNMSDQIASAGYQTATPDNTGSVETTSIRFAEGYEAEAKALAQVVGSSPDATSPLEGDLGVDLQGAQLVVLLATDLASGG